MTIHSIDNNPEDVRFYLESNGTDISLTCEITKSDETKISKQLDVEIEDSHVEMFPSKELTLLPSSCI
jgi:hypothetical protein